MLLLLWLSGCSTKPPQSSDSSFTRHTSDSTIIREVIRPVLVLIPGDTVTNEILLECDPATNKPLPISQSLRNKHAALNLVIDQTGRLKATATCDELRETLEQVDRELIRIKREIQDRSEAKVLYQTNTEYKTRWYDTACRWFTCIVLLLIVLKQIVKRIKSPL